ncbi:MAG TPA: molybdopterin-guanine dinucleotide biosynthesis protein B [Candidatus Ozemobacteraceae bacterium]|nr:molybdopterin-guanine dinucleotide biosynthesis protein B [Candidatus Ozemobacteraceae bacterium]
MEKLPPIIRVLGRSGSGKTTLIETLIRELQPLRIGVAKHTRHHLELPANTKDTTRYAAAGAVVSSGLSPADAEMFVRVPWNWDDVLAMMTKHVDLILVEGARDLDLPTILVGEAPEGACLKNVLTCLPRYPVLTPEVIRVVGRFIQNVRPE